MLSVYVLNDETTPWAFVVTVMEKVFDKSSNDARELMLETHSKGCALCGLYETDRAEELAICAQKLAERSGHPLRFETRPASC